MDRVLIVDDGVELRLLVERLGANGFAIETVRGSGYLFVAGPR